jgi:hypothetical protein
MVRGRARNWSLSLPPWYSATLVATTMSPSRIEPGRSPPATPTKSTRWGWNAWMTRSHCNAVTALPSPIRAMVTCQVHSPPATDPVSYCVPRRGGAGCTPSRNSRTASYSRPSAVKTTAVPCVRVIPSPRSTSRRLRSSCQNDKHGPDARKAVTKPSNPITQGEGTSCPSHSLASHTQEPAPRCRRASLECGAEGCAIEAERAGLLANVGWRV